MENASKALIIAGAILISILLIGVSMMIYNSSQDITENARRTMSQQDIDAFNSQWTKYEGNQPGASVLGLIKSLKSNASEKVNGKDIARIPTLVYGTTAECEEGKVDEYFTNLGTIEKTIVRSKTYDVTCSEDHKTGLVKTITITLAGSSEEP